MTAAAAAAPLKRRWESYDSSANVISPVNSPSDALKEEKAKLEALSLFPPSRYESRLHESPVPANSSRLNKFVRGLHQMLTDEKEKGVVDWKRGVLILHSTERFTEEVLPKYFNTRNFKTFRRQLNYYGNVELRNCL